MRYFFWWAGLTLFAIAGIFNATEFRADAIERMLLAAIWLLLAAFWIRLDEREQHRGHD